MTSRSVRESLQIGMRRTAPARPSSTPPESSNMAGSVIVRSLKVAPITSAMPISSFISLPVTTFCATASYFAARGAQAISPVQLGAQIGLNHKDLRSLSHPPQLW